MKNMKNNNDAVIRKITARCIIANKKYSAVITVAIALTGFMLAVFFSVLASTLASARDNFIWHRGTAAHMFFMNPTAHQQEIISGLGYVRHAGILTDIGAIDEEADWFYPTLVYADHVLRSEMLDPAWREVIGRYPRYAGEIMASQEALARVFGIFEPELGMSVDVTWRILCENDEMRETAFVISGFYNGFDPFHNFRANIYVAAEFADAFPSEQSGMYIVYTGGRFFPDTLIYDFEALHSWFTTRLISDAGLLEEQLPADYLFFFSGSVGEYIFFLVVLLIIMFFADMLIYNVMHISVSRDMRFYGLLKSIGASPRQIRQIVRGVAFRLAVVAIPVGIAAGILASFVYVPILTSFDDFVVEGSGVFFSPVILAALFTLSRIYISAGIPARKVANISPAEAVRYIAAPAGGEKSRLPSRGKPWRLALRNIFRDKRRAAIVITGLGLGMAIFVFSTSFIQGEWERTVYTHARFRDFVLYDFGLYEDGYSLFTEEFIETLQDLPGVIDVFPVAREPITTSLEPTQNLAKIMKIVPPGRLAELHPNITQNELDAFGRGETAYIFTDEPEAFAGQDVIEGIFTSPPGGKTFTANIAGVEPMGEVFFFTFTTVPPTYLVVSHAFMQNYVAKHGISPPNIARIFINSDWAYDAELLQAIRHIDENAPRIPDSHVTGRILFNTNVDERLMMMDVVWIVTFTAAGLSGMLGLTGILNFANSMVSSVVGRRREFAILESVGMSRRQIRYMLLSEGIIYAAASAAIGTGLGTAIAYFLFSHVVLFPPFMYIWHDITFDATLTFAFPAIPILIFIAIIFAVCTVTSLLAYRSMQKTPVVERLKAEVSG